MTNCLYLQPQLVLGPVGIPEIFNKYVNLYMYVFLYLKGFKTKSVAKKTYSGI